MKKRRNKSILIIVLILILLSFFIIYGRIGKQNSKPILNISDDECYLGMSLSSDFIAFNSDSPWRTPIGDNPKVDANSEAMIQGIKDKLSPFGSLNNVQLTIAYKIYTAPVHVINSDACPRANITSKSALPTILDANGDKVAENIPLPPQAWADPSDDSHLILIDPVRRISWEFWNFKKDSNGKATIGMGGKWDLNGLGYNIPDSSPAWWRNGATGPKTAYIGGLLRYDEMVFGEINHALNIITPNNRNKFALDGSGTKEFCSPVASRTDGRNNGEDTIPEGVRIQLNPNLDLDSLGLNEHTKIIARALQKYGAYVMDSGAGFGIKAQNLGADGGAWKNFNDINMEKIPVDEFRVLDCNILYGNQ